MVEFEDGAGRAVVCAAAGASGVGAVGVGSDAGQKGELARSWAVLGVEAFGGAHPGLFCLPPCP